ARQFGATSGTVVRVPSRLQRRLLALLFGLTAWLIASVAAAAGEDSAVHEAVAKIMSEDYPGNLAPARRRLQEQLSVCLKKGCGGAVKAEVYTALGMVASQAGQAEDAKQAFSSAQQADPSAKLPSSGATPAMKAQWDEAKPSGGSSGGGGGAASGGEAPAE